MSGWTVIETLVEDLGDLSAQVHVAERTLATDPRTRAARVALERATEALCTAIDETSSTAADRAASAIQDTRSLLAELGVAVQTSRTLAGAARRLIAQSERERKRADDLRRRLLERKRGKA